MEALRYLLGKGVPPTHPISDNDNVTMISGA
jgi:hypothetical protein